MRGNKYGLCVSGSNNNKVTKIFRLLLYKINNCIKYAIILFVQYSEVLWLTRQSSTCCLLIIQIFWQRVVQQYFLLTDILLSDYWRTEVFFRQRKCVLRKNSQFVLAIRLQDILQLHKSFAARCLFYPPVKTFMEIEPILSFSTSKLLISLISKHYTFFNTFSFFRYSSCNPNVLYRESYITALTLQLKLQLL